MKTHLTFLTSRRARILGTLTTGMALLWACPSLSAVDLLRNGSFENILAHWHTPDNMAETIPYSPQVGGVSMSAPDWTYTGPLLSQPLNIAGASGQTVTVRMDLLMLHDTPEGANAALYLDYRRADGTLGNLLALKPTNAEVGAERTSFSAQVTLPMEAERLVGVSLHTEGYGPVYVLGVGLESPVLTAGATPQIAQATAVVQYSGTLVITGSGFGTDPGVVRLGGAVAGLTLLSWSNDRIEMRVDDPARTGYLSVECAGVRTWQQRVVRIASPHFTLRSQAPVAWFLSGHQVDHAVAAAGQEVAFDLEILAFNGFTAEQGILLTAPANEDRVRFGRSMVYGQGGARAFVDTTGLTPGHHGFLVQAETPGLLPRTVILEVEILQLTSLELVRASNWDPLSFPLSLTSHAVLPVQLRLLDSLGREVGESIPTTWVSSNPGVVRVFRGASRWESHPHFVTEGNGTATITATAPDGTSWGFEVTVAIPAGAPSITAIAFQPPVINNNHSDEVFVSFNTSGPISQYGYSYGSLPGHISNWSASGVFGRYDLEPMEGAMPGTYLITVNATVEGTPCARGATIQVLNAPDKAMMEGHIAPLAEPEMAFYGASGEMHFHHPVTGELLLSVSIFGTHSLDYALPYLPPGDYKLRFALEYWGSGQVVTEWYPGVDSMAEAEVVTLVAGEVRSGVDFFPTLATTPVAPPPVLAPALDLVTGTFSVPIQTEPNRVYELQRSSTLQEGSWVPVGILYGNGGVLTLEDANASPDGSYYRIRVQ